MKYLAIISVLLCSLSVKSECIIGMEFVNNSSDQVHVNTGNIQALKKEGILTPSGYKVVEPGGGKVCFRQGFSHGIWIAGSAQKDAKLYVIKDDVLRDLKIVQHVMLGDEIRLFNKSKEGIGAVAAGTTQQILQLSELNEWTCGRLLADYIPLVETVKIKKEGIEIDRNLIGKRARCIGSRSQEDCIKLYVSEYAHRFKQCMEHRSI